MVLRYPDCHRMGDYNMAHFEIHMVLEAKQPYIDLFSLFNKLYVIDMNMLRKETASVFHK